MAAQPFATLLYLLPPLISAVISLVLLGVVISSRGHDLVHCIFSLLLVCMALWGFAIFAMRASPDTTHALQWDKIVPPLGMASGAFYLHFSLLMTRNKGQRWLLGIAYLLTGIVIIMSRTNLFISAMGIRSYGYSPVLGLGMYAVSIFGYVMWITPMVNFMRASRHSTTYEERNRMLLLGFAMIWPIIGGTLEVVPSVYPTSIFGNILFGVFATIAIVKYHLFDVRVVIRKSVAYLLTSTVVAIPIIGAILLFNQFFGEKNFTIWMSIILLLIVAVVLQALWLRMQNLVDRLFFRERYDFLRELERFSREVHDISDLNKLGSSLVDLIGWALQTANVQLFVSDESGYFNLIASTGQSVSGVTFSSNSPLIRWMSRNKEMLYRHQVDVTPQLQSLTAKEKSILTNLGIELFIPLRNNKDELIGLLTLGKKRSEQPYSGEDVRRISTVANRVAIELENARLYARETSIRMEMQRQNEQKTEFLHHVAHELKTPLTAIISSSELVTSEELMVNPEQKERLLTNINRSAWLMDKRVGELLDLARIQIGTLELKLEPVDIKDVIHDLTSQLSALFKNKEQTIAADIQESLPKVRADKERVEEILINLLSNANKFSPARGNILVRASMVRNKIVVEVKDSAPLISNEDKGRIFNAYYRGGTDEDRQRISGLGLGLAISKSLIELHHGEIGVRNEDDSGNIFYFTLPVWGVGEDKQAESAPTISHGGG